MGSAAAFSPPSPPRPAPEAGTDLPRPPPQPAGGAGRGRGRPQEQEKLGEPPPHRRRPQPWGPRARGSRWEGMASWSSPPPLLPGGTPVTKLGHGEPTEARVEGGGRDQSSVRPCQTGPSGPETGPPGGASAARGEQSPFPAPRPQALRARGGCSRRPGAREEEPRAVPEPRAARPPGPLCTPSPAAPPAGAATAAAPSRSPAWPLTADRPWAKSCPPHTGPCVLTPHPGCSVYCNSAKSPAPGCQLYCVPNSLSDLERNHRPPPNSGLHFPHLPNR